MLKYWDARGILGAAEILRCEGKLRCKEGHHSDENRIGIYKYMYKCITKV